MTRISTRRRARAAGQPLVLLLNGPNLNWLGKRETSIYGKTSYEGLVADLEELAAGLGLRLTAAQSNHEGALIDCLQETRAAGVILNPGGLAHGSVCLRDAVAALTVPVIEVHLSNLAAREPFRQHSLLAPVCAGVIMGLGVAGYHLALRHLAERLGRCP